MTDDGVLVQSTAEAHWAWVGARLRPAPILAENRLYPEADELAWLRQAGLAERAWLAGQWTTAHGTRWELRYTNDLATKTVSAALLGRVHGTDLAEVRAAALMLRDRLVNPPRHVRGEPITDAGQLATVLAPVGPDQAHCVELRKPLAWAWRQHRDDDRRVYFAFAPLGGENRSWEPVWHELSRLAAPTSISVYLEPYQPTEHLQGNLQLLANQYELYATPRTTNALWQHTQPADPFAVEAVTGYRTAAHRYRRECYRLRISVLSAAPLPPGFAELLGEAAGGAVACPVAAADRALAYRNVTALNREWLDQTYPQGSPPGALSQVERDLTDLIAPGEAHAAFRFPYQLPGHEPLFGGGRPPGGLEEAIDSVTDSEFRKRLFVSYVRADTERVDRLVLELRKAGYDVWLDRSDLLPGMRWRSVITKAIRDGHYFLACFSRNYGQRDSYMNEELIEAVDRLRGMPRDRNWFIPIMLDKDCALPDYRIGPGETLDSIQFADFTSGGDESGHAFDADAWAEAVRRLCTVLGPP